MIENSWYFVFGMVLGLIFLGILAGICVFGCAPFEELEEKELLEQ